MKARSWGLLALVLALLPACSGGSDGRLPVHPVRGSVFHNEKPAAGAVVTFHPLKEMPQGTPLPRAQVAPDGTFQLTTYITNDGAPAGDYLVTIAWHQPTEYAEQKGASLLPAHYADPKRSGLRATVEPGSNEIPPFRPDRKP